MRNLALLLPRLGRMMASLLTDREVPVSAKLVLAAMAVYLASPASSFMTGQVLRIDGGFALP